MVSGKQSSNSGMLVKRIVQPQQAQISQRTMKQNLMTEKQQEKKTNIIWKIPGK